MSDDTALNPSVLSGLRAELAAALDKKVTINILGTDGNPLEVQIPAIARVPGSFDPPIILIGPGVPYIEPTFEGMTWGERRYNLAATAIVYSGIVDDAIDEIDAMTIGLVDAISSLKDWWVPADGVSQPGQTSVNNQPYLANTVMATTIRRG